MDKVSKKRLFPCPHCEAILRSNFSLKRHGKRVHNEVILNNIRQKTGKCICLECKKSFQKIIELRSHLTSEHGFEFFTESKYFESESDFERWKTNLEKKEVCHFSKITGKKTLKTGEKVTYYECNRSGIHKSICKGEVRMRKLKSQGVSKIGYKCTATIKIRHNLDETLYVEICYTHYGHSKDSKHIPRNRKYEADLKELREQVQGEIKELIAEIEKCEDLEALQQLEKSIQQIVDTFGFPLRENSMLHDHNYHKKCKVEHPSISEQTKVRDQDINFDSSWLLEDLICCKCFQMDQQSNMVRCEGCEHWFDWACAGITEMKNEWFCESCQDTGNSE